MILTNQAGFTNWLIEIIIQCFYKKYQHLNISTCSDILVLGSLIGFEDVKVQVCFINLMTTLSPSFEKLSGVKPPLMNRHFFIAHFSAWHSFSNVYLPFFWNGFMTDNIIITGVKYHSQECMEGILSQFSNQGTYLTALYLHQQYLSLYASGVCTWNTHKCFCVVRHVLPSIFLISVVRQAATTQHCEAGLFKFGSFFSCVFYFQLFLFSIRFILRAI